VRAALSGDLSGDDIRLELDRPGWANGVAWDGKAHRIPRSQKEAPEVSAFRGALVAEALPENPFSPGPALSGDLPPGREPTIREILALVRKKRPAPAILRGPRRSGKTSILHHLRARLEGTHHVRLVTLEGRSEPLRSADDLARIIEPSLASRKTPPADALRKRLQKEKKPLLLVDEIANLAEADASTFAWLRALGQEGTAVVLVGSHWDWVRVVERAAAIMPGSSFGNDVTPVTLDRLKESDALRFLVETAPPDVPLAPDGTARWILDLCGGWPFYLQVMGFAVVQAVREGERRALVEREGVRDLYEQRLLLDRNAGYFATRWAELPERVRGVLDTIRTLPKGERPVYRDLPPEDRQALRDTGLCNALGAWLEDEPFFDWIVRIKDEGRR
jgi:hypothetical protein